MPAPRRGRSRSGSAPGSARCPASTALVAGRPGRSAWPPRTGVGNSPNRSHRRHLVRRSAAARRPSGRRPARRRAAPSAPRAVAGARSRGRPAGRAGDLGSAVMRRQRGSVAEDRARRGARPRRRGARRVVNGWNGGPAARRDLRPQRLVGEPAGAGDRVGDVGRAHRRGRPLVGADTRSRQVGVAAAGWSCCAAPATPRPPCAGSADRPAAHRRRCRSSRGRVGR